MTTPSQEAYNQSYANRADSLEARARAVRSAIELMGAGSSLDLQFITALREIVDLTDPFELADKVAELRQAFKDAYSEAYFRIIRLIESTDDPERQEQFRERFYVWKRNFEALLDCLYEFDKAAHYQIAAELMLRSAQTLEQAGH
ncbi:MAG: hypothetical protein QNJ15_02130 [Erythrobacter sp.]|nr:hypothetical protein [Erythrobacter sp.]